MTEHIVAVFDTVAHADAAQAALIQAGIGASTIERYRPGEAGAPTTAELEAASNEGYRESTASGGSSGGGFWARLFGDEPEYSNERPMYEAHHAAGRVIVAVSALEGDQAALVMDILERHAPSRVQSEPESDTVRSANLSSNAGSTLSSTPDVVAGERADPLVGARHTPDDRSTEEVIPLSEEQMAVGKRTVNLGTTRIRRYVVNRPVEETIALRDESTTVERRAPTGSGLAGDNTAFTDRTIEVTSTREEPVVEKSVRVAEEVVVKRAATERTEVVKDTVRREQVDIDKGTGAAFPEPSESTEPLTPQQQRSVDRA